MHNQYQLDHLSEKKWYLLKAVAQGQFEILQGSYKIFNKSFKDHSRIEFNSGDSYILFTETMVKINYSESINIERLLSSPIPSDWLSLKIEISPVIRNRIMVLGASDSGKTTLLKFLAYNLPKNNQKIGLIDLDVGQNSLGLPGTINLATFNFNGAKLLFSKYFGHISPAGNSNLFLKIVKSFFESIQEFDFDWLFIDTSGYIQTSEAIIIKNGLLKIINPQVVLLIGEGAKNLDKKLIPGNITYLPIESAIEGIKREKNLEIRRRKRSERFGNYFKDLSDVELLIKNIERIIINFEKDFKELTNFEEINYFLIKNKDKIIHSFIAVTDFKSGMNQYAKLVKINEESITISVPKTIQFPEKCKLVIGSIILD